MTDSDPAGESGEAGLRERIPPGSYTPLVTPFLDGRVDLEAFDRLVERQALGGARGVVVTGTSGEPSSLTVEERAELFDRAVKAAAGRVLTVAAVGCPDRAGTLALAAAATEAGADAVMVVAPAFVKPSQAGLEEHFRVVAESTHKPVILYNIPGRAAVSIEAATVRRVAESCPNVVGVKHASPDLDYLTELILSLGEDFRLFCGLESYSYPFLAVGAAGLMSAVGNLLPRSVAQLCDAVAAGDHETGLRLHRRLFAVNKAVFFDTNPVPLKAMLAACGVVSAEVRPPLAPLSAETKKKTMKVLTHYLDEAMGDPALPFVPQG